MGICLNEYGNKTSMMKCPLGKGMRWWRDKHGLEFIMDLVPDDRDDKNAECKCAYTVDNGAFSCHTVSKAHIYHRVMHDFMIKMKKRG